MKREFAGNLLGERNGFEREIRCLFQDKTEMENVD